MSSEQPSLIGGHVQYVKGAAESVIGSVTGAQAWNSSAKADKTAGIDAMKQASANRDPQQSGFGKVEEMAGKMTGCEGMEKEGGQSKQS
ncbi:hypothetical protein LTR08_006501 [Meristemomyces frigidus]|nr:hypothetical protein LTR08_006501 [Meristemomyces frigidus]